MLISRNIRKKLTVLAVGSSLLAGCSSGPQLSSVRFWPGGDKMESAADDEAVAQKWRDRLNASALSNGSGAAPGFETARADEDPAQSRRSRFNIFRRFSRKQEAEAPQTPTPAEVAANREQQRLALERRIAQLEAEQRTLQRSRATARNQQAAPTASRPESEVSDPFLAATSTAAPEKKQIVRPAIRPAPQVNTDLPSWAQTANGQNSAPSASKAAESPAAEPVAPRQQPTLNDLADASAPQAPQGKAPAMPLDAQPTITPRTRNPFAELEQKKVADTPVPPESGRRQAQKPQPQVTPPVAESGKRQQLSALRSAKEQQQVWAHLEVQQLLKRSRIQARAGQLHEALTTALAAEQLASSAEIEFSDREQTPAQLVALIRLKAEETQSSVAERPRSSAAPQTRAPQEAVVAQQPKPNLNVQPATPPAFVAQRVSTKEVSPPQWPGRTTELQPQQVAVDHPLVSTPAASPGSAADRNLKTAEFIHSRPEQSVEPYAPTSDQWFSTDNRPRTQPSLTSGRYMEVSRPARNQINAQFASSTTIYSPENLQWVSLEASQATIPQEDAVPAPPELTDFSTDPAQLLPTYSEEETDDPFAAAFAQDEVSDTLLTSDDPLSKFAPPVPVAANEPAASSEEMLLLGIPLRKLVLVLLAGLILLAAIIHRRRTSDLHEI